MKAGILAAALVAALASTAANAATTAPPSGRYLVVFKTEVLPADALSRITKQGGKVNRAFDQIGVVVVNADAGFVTRMSRDSKVLSVGTEHVFQQPDVLSREFTEEELAGLEGAPTAADVYYKGYQWDMRRMGAPAVWARLPVAATAPRVAVLDTGVMDTHPDLVGQLDASVSTTYCNTSGGANNSPAYPQYSSYIDLDAFPNWTPADGCSVAPNTTYESHGTHVAGTIAAKFGGGGVVGVAPDAKVGAFKVFDRYRYTDGTGLHDAVGAFDGPLFSAITMATQAGYPVISMSLGSHVMRNDKGSAASWHSWDRIAKWANRNGTLLIASAGNSAYNLNGTLAHVPSDLSTVMSTSATGTSQLLVSGGMVVAAPGSDVLAEYSNYGSSVDVAAPGGDCGPGPTCVGQYLIANTGISATGGATYLLMAGTSMATPHVSAVAAYVRSIHPEFTPGDTRSWIKDHAQAIGSRQFFGAGLVDADASAH